MKKEYLFDVQTSQNCNLHFLTTAKDGKTALVQMLMNSSDFKNIVKGNKDFTIKIERIKTKRKQPKHGGEMLNTEAK